MTRRTFLVTVDVVPVADFHLTEKGICNLIAHQVTHENVFLNNAEVTPVPDSVQPINNEGSPAE